MNLVKFKQLLQEGGSPPQNMSDMRKALWYDSNGNWHRAHEIVQDIQSSDAFWIHAYLHRKEGDLGNALYWYNKAGQKKSEEGLEKEWEQIAQHLLSA